MPSLISARLIGYGAAALAVVLMLAAWQQRGAQLDTARASLAAANARVALMQGEVSACRGVISAQNEQVSALKAKADAANEAAQAAARAVLQRPRRPLAGHGPGPMNAWLEGLR